MRIFEITQFDKEALCRQAPEFEEIVRQADLSSFECCGNLFLALVQSIVSQQLAIKAADAIFRRVEALLGEVTAERLLAVSFDELRSCGLSGRKIEYLRVIAEAKISGAIDFEALAKKSDAEVIAELVKLKGVGVWTAEMLLIFALGRPDVLSFKDLGIRRGIMMLNHLDIMTEADFETYRKRYSPYGTLASLYLWRIKDGGLSVAKQDISVICDKKALALVKKHISTNIISSTQIDGHGIVVEFESKHPYLTLSLEFDYPHGHLYFEILDMTHYVDGELIALDSPRRKVVISEPIAGNNIPKILNMINDKLSQGVL